jgi:hypothetical protein
MYTFESFYIINDNLCHHTMNKTLAIMLAAAFTVAALSTTTISMGAATPAFADQRCSTTGTIETCIGGTSDKHLAGEAFSSKNGGGGARGTFDSSTGDSTFSGGRGGLYTDGSGFVGGEGAHQTCVGGECTTVGGSGIHVK